MADCIFCQIAAHKIPSEIVYEDEDFVAFLDIDPRSPGHVQVIPKKHYRWVWQVPNVGDYFEVVRKIAVAQQKAFGQEAIWSRITGEDIAHAHIWIFPRPNDRSVGRADSRPNKTVGDKKDLAGNAEKIRKVLSEK